MVNRLATHLNRRGSPLGLRPFTPVSGSDERQFCSPGFDLPIGQMARSVHGDYDGYHNSLDSKSFMTIEALIDSIDKIEVFLYEVDNAGLWHNLAPYGEPQLGRRGLYPAINSAQTWNISSDDVFDGRVILDQILYLLNYSDGRHDLIDIAERYDCSVSDLIIIVQRLMAAGLVTDQQATG
jgi:aminopeptidase-like protein